VTASRLAVGRRLAARTVALDDADADLAAVAGDDGVLWENEGGGFAGRGEALRIDVEPGADVAAEVAEALAAVETTDEVGRPGCGPVAVGALPFAPGAPASLVVPSVLVGRAADGTAWLTTVGSEDGGPLPRGLSPAPVPSSYHVTATRPAASWVEAVEAATRAIRAGDLAKVVLAREVVVEADCPLSPAHVAARLRQAYPTCFVFSVDGMVGASPELLVARWGEQVHSQPMAGTAPRGDGPEADARLAAALLASAKEREEHDLTVAAVVDALGPVCEELHAGAGPSIVAVANVQHLATAVRGRLRAPAPTALGLAARLHPTPAVCGAPRATALALLRHLERFDRGRYAGPVGWVDRHGDGQWAVAIRVAEIDGARARLVAGAGIVADSEPEAELVETQVKLQALLNAVVRP
jgi:menaquinone-specific isochorismate synthase